MNSRDLNSINEAFAAATAKVVAEGTETVKEDWDDEYSDPEADAAVAAAGPHVDDSWTPQEGDKVSLQDGSNEVGTVIATVPGDQYEIKFDNPEIPNAVHPKDNLALDQPAADEANISSNIMDDYESRLSRHFGVKREKNESGKEYKQPDEKVSEVDSKTQRPKGEVKADEKSKDVGGAKEDLQEPVEAAEDKEEKKSKKEKKSVKESINTSNKGTIMSEDKSIFDKLYEQVMGEDDEFDSELGFPAGDDEGLGDELGDEGGEEVTVTLTPDQADALKAVVDQLPSDEEELGDDELGGDEFGGPEGAPDENFESVEEDHTPTTGKPTSDGTKPGVDPSDGGGKTTDPAADSLGGKSSGTGDAKVTDDAATTGKPTTDGKTVGKAGGKHPSGKPGKLKANSKT